MYLLALLAEHERNNHFPKITPLDITWPIESWVSTVRQFTRPVAPLVGCDFQFESFVHSYMNYLEEKTA